MNFFRKAMSISSITLVSRILGMVRDALIAFVFGASLVSDIFFIAFRPFDLARKMTADGILSISFIPVFSRYLAENRKDRAVSMFLSACFWIALVSALVVGVGIYLAPWLVRFLAPGYAQGTYAHTLSVLLLKIMFPYILVILMVALSMAVLNSLGNFHIPAATPIVLNLVIIAGAWFLSDWFRPRVMVLALGVTLGGLAQLALQIPWLIRAGMMAPGHFVFFHPGLVRGFKALVPSMVGAAAFQVNVLVAGLLASKLLPGSVSYLYYAERLVQFPLALFAASVSTVLLPALSNRAAVRDMEGIRPVFESGVRLVLFLTIPAMAGMMALNRPIVSLLFSRGAFDGAAVVQTGDCLFYLVAGLWAMAGTRLFVTFHFALSNVRLPFVAGLVTLGTNAALSGVLAKAMGVTGLALSVALSSIAGFLFLILLSTRGLGLGTLIVSACRAVFISGIMAGLVRWIWGFWEFETALIRGVGLMAAIAAGVLFFFSAAMLLAGQEMDMFKKVIQKNDNH